MKDSQKQTESERARATRVLAGAEIYLLHFNPLGVIDERGPLCFWFYFLPSDVHFFFVSRVIDKVAFDWESE